MVGESLSSATERPQNAKGAAQPQWQQGPELSSLVPDPSQVEPSYTEEEEDISSSLDCPCMALPVAQMSVAVFQSLCSEMH